MHHCVWLLPAIIRCVDAGLPAPGSDRRPLLPLGAAAYLLMTSRLVWVWEHASRPPLELIGGNLYFWFSLAFCLAFLPLGEPDRLGAGPEPLHSTAERG